MKVNQVAAGLILQQQWSWEHQVWLNTNKLDCIMFVGTTKPRCGNVVSLFDHSCTDYAFCVVSTVQLSCSRLYTTVAFSRSHPDVAFINTTFLLLCLSNFAVRTTNITVVAVKTRKVVS